VQITCIFSKDGRINYCKDIRIRGGYIGISNKNAAKQDITKQSRERIIKTLNEFFVSSKNDLIDPLKFSSLSVVFVFVNSYKNT